VREILERLGRIPVPRFAKPSGRMRRALRRFASQPLNVAGFAFLAIVALLALCADLVASDKPIACRLDGRLYLLPCVARPAALADEDNFTIERAVAARGGWTVLPPVPFGPNQTKVAGRVGRLEGPGRAHPLGTDDLGRDVLARMVHGARSAMLVGFGSVVLYALIGILLGALAAYFGGPTDKIVMRLIETLSSFPSLFLILAVQGLLGVSTLWQLVAVIGLTRWSDVARLTRGEVLRVANEDYVTAARALGLGPLHILWRHVMPNSMGPVLVACTFGVAGAILIESTLSFLGFGVPPPTPSWGQLLTEAFGSEGSYWLTLFPGIALFATIVSVNLVGEGLREALSPKAKGARL
jgi:peptide/nickel transport system permease protein